LAGQTTTEESRHNYYQYTCGQLHVRRNSEWEKLTNLWKYYGKTEFDPYASIDAIEKTTWCEA